MRLGYNTNGFAHHRVGDALTILAEIGYQGVALTLERDHLDSPDRTGVDACVRWLEPLVDEAGLSVTIETGSRFILDPRRKHQPTLISAGSEDRRRRIEFIKAAIDVAAGLSAESVSLWSGSTEDTADDARILDRLNVSLQELLDHAGSRGVRLSFEPEPGMFIDTMARFGELFAHVNHSCFGLTLDVGHIHCQGDGEIGDSIRRWRDVLWNVHIEDMRVGTHEHLMFGEGGISFPPIFDALREINYEGPVHIELSRHSHDAVDVARRSFEFLQGFMK